MRLIEHCYKSGKVIPGIFFLRIKDILASFFLESRFPKRYGFPTKWNGISLKSIFDFEKTKEKNLMWFHMLHFHSICNMFRYHTTCNFLIYPFENQPWDKMMILAMRKVGGKCKLIGCQHTTSPQLLLNFFLGNREWIIHPQPDVIVANGKYWESVLRGAAFKCQVRNGGSLRFVKPNIEKWDLSNNDSKRKRSVLVLLSNTLNYSLDLIFYLLRNNDMEYLYLLKTHPDLDEQNIRNFIHQFPKNFVFVEGTMDQWMRKAGWAIHIGTTAAIECLLHGVIVFKYLPEVIDIDPLLGMNIDQITITGDKVLQFNDEGHLTTPDPSLIAEPFNENTWNNLLELS